MKQIGTILRNKQFGIEGILVSRVVDKEFVIATKDNTCLKVPVFWKWEEVGKVDTTTALQLYEKYLEFVSINDLLWNIYELADSYEKEIENGNTLE